MTRPIDKFHEALEARGIPCPRGFDRSEITRENRDRVVEAWLEAMDPESDAKERAQIAQDVVWHTLRISQRRRVYPVLLELFRESAGWSPGCAIEMLGLKDIGEDLIPLLAPEYGRGRQRLAAALGRCEHPGVVPTLLSLLPDPEVRGHALEGLERAKWAPSTEEHSRLLRSIAAEGPAWVTRHAAKLLGEVAPKKRRPPKPLDLGPPAYCYDLDDSILETIARTLDARFPGAENELRQRRLWWPNDRAWARLDGSEQSVWVLLDGTTDEDDDCVEVCIFGPPPMVEDIDAIVRATFDAEGY